MRCGLGWRGVPGGALGCSRSWSRSASELGPELLLGQSGLASGPSAATLWSELATQRGQAVQTDGALAGAQPLAVSSQ